MRGELLVESRTAMGAARERSDALYSNWGIGALEVKQQDLSDALPSNGPRSSMFIWPHRDCVSGVAHSASCEENSAQTESGPVPSPSRVSANPKISARLTMSSLTDRPFFRLRFVQKPFYRTSPSCLRVLLKASAFECRQKVDEVVDLLLCRIGRKRRHRRFRIVGLHPMDHLEQLVSRESGTDIRKRWPNGATLACDAVTSVAALRFIESPTRRCGIRRP